MCVWQPVTASVFIDASYDGDLMVAAGDVRYTWGREACHCWGGGARPHSTWHAALRLPLPCIP